MSMRRVDDLDKPQETATASMSTDTAMPVHRRATDPQVAEATRRAVSSVRYAGMTQEEKRVLGLCGW